MSTYSSPSTVYYIKPTEHSNYDYMLETNIWIQHC